MHQASSFLLAFVFSVMSVFSASAQQVRYGLPFLVNVDDKLGYMDAQCRMVVPATYSEAFPFTEGVAAVKIGKKWGFIDQTGNTVIQPVYAGAFLFSEGLASVRLEESSPLFGFIDKTGKVVIQPQFGMPLRFSEGLVEGYGEEDNVLNIPLGYVDTSGKYAIRLHESGQRIEFLVGFSEGLARVSMQRAFNDGSVGEARWGYIDHSGNWAIPRTFDLAGDFQDGLAAVSSNGLWGFIDKEGEFVISPKFEGAEGFSEGLAAVQAAGRWGFIDKSGQVVIEPRFERVSDFQSGLARFLENRKIGYINKRRDVVIPPTIDFGSADDFVEGLLLVDSKAEIRILNTSGGEVCRFKK